MSNLGGTVMTRQGWLIAPFALLLLPCTARAVPGALGQSARLACARPPVDTTDGELAVKAVTRSYLAVRNAHGFHSEPLVLKRTVGGTRLTVIGTRHITNPDSLMYRSTTLTLDTVRPELILHESDAPSDLGLETEPQAIQRAADLGFIAHYARQHGITFRSADAPVSAEIAELLSDHTPREVFVFLTAQRLVGSASHPDLAATATAYPSFLTNYLERNGLPIDPSWRSWEGFVSAYEALVGRSLTSATWSRRQLDPTVTGGPLNGLARASDRIRDRWLLKAIRGALPEYDRIVVQFGVYHVLAIESVLDQLPFDYTVAHRCIQ
jgi:hypothetical protein